MEMIIKPQKWSEISWRELWNYRELFYILAWRDIKVRYKQTTVGALWAIIQPFMMMVVFSTFFGRIAGISTEEAPYPIFVYSGLIFWNYFSNSLASASDSLVANKAIIQKIYFPRIIIPISSTIVFLLDFLFASLVLVGLMIYYGYIPSLSGMLVILPSVFITFFSASGLGFFLAAVNVKYRDVRYILPFFIQLLVFVTPVIYPTSVLGTYQWLWYLNPMSGVIDTIRATLFQVRDPSWNLFFSSLMVSIIFFIIGLLFFKKTERYFADVA